MSKTAALLPVALVLAYAATSLAGGKADQVVTILPTNVTGSMAATRNTTDANAKIGCWAVGVTGSTSAACLATGGSGTTLACSSTDPGIVKAIQAVNPSSHIAFTVGLLGVCDNVVIDNGSLFGRKK